jgi:hypothetical protein
VLISQLVELIAENQTLRNVVRSLSNFIGDGAGGALPSMGWTLKEFEAFINKAETDTAFEAFAKRKKALQDGLVTPSDKKSPAEDLNVSRKRPRTMSTNGALDAMADVNFGSSIGSAFGSYNSDAPAMGLYSNMRPPAGFGPAFLNSVGSDQPGSNSFIPSGPSSNAGLGFQSSPTTTNGRDAYPPSYAPGASATPQPTASSSTMQNMPFMQVSNGNNATPPQTSQATGNVEDNVLEDPKAQEARKLVGSVILVLRVLCLTWCSVITWKTIGATLLTAYLHLFGRHLYNGPWNMVSITPPLCVPLLTLV